MKSIGVAIKKKGSAQDAGLQDYHGKENGTGEMLEGAVNPEGAISQLHLNIWKPKTHWFTVDEIFVLDFGFRFPKDCDSVYFYFPFKLAEYKTRQTKKKRVWTDLGEVMAENSDLICTIFNEELQTTKIPNTCFYKVSDLSETAKGPEGKNEKSFYLYTLGDTNIEFDKGIEDGTLMKIKICDIDNLHDDKGIDTIYIRFRVFVKADDIRKRRSISNDLIQTAFSKMDLYDIRINEKINLDRKIREKFRENSHQLVQFKKAHIFYICSAKTTVQNGSVQKNDSRIVDSEKWKYYEPFRMLGNIYLAHHWKFEECSDQGKCSDQKKCSLHDIKLFCTAQYPKLQLFTLVTYFLLIILLGAIGSFLAAPGPDKLAILHGYWTRIAFISAVAVIALWLARPLRVKLWIWIKEL